MFDIHALTSYTVERCAIENIESTGGSKFEILGRPTYLVDAVIICVTLLHFGTAAPQNSKLGQIAIYMTPRKNSAGYGWAHCRRQNKIQSLLPRWKYLNFSILKPKCVKAAGVQKKPNLAHLPLPL